MYLKLILSLINFIKLNLFSNNKHSENITHEVNYVFYRNVNLLEAMSQDLPVLKLPILTPKQTLLQLLSRRFTHQNLN